MNKKLYPIINLLVVGLTIFMSYYSNTGAMNGNTMGSLSNRYDALFTPASYAFSIWGIIYIGLIGHSISLFRIKDSATSMSQAQWMTLSNLGNCAWVFLWLYEYTALSTLAMAFILFSLVRLGLATHKIKGEVSEWIWAPVSIYLGWITVALAANVSAYLVKINFELLLNEPQWAVALILIASGVYAFILNKVKLELAILVGVWALVAIAVKQWDKEALVQWSALACAVLLSVLALMSFLRTRKA